MHHYRIDKQKYPNMRMSFLVSVDAIVARSIFIPMIFVDTIEIEMNAIGRSLSSYCSVSSYCRNFSIQFN